jgi:hypothetical protein
MSCLVMYTFFYDEAAVLEKSIKFDVARLEIRVK